jgi:hypothetical protein
MTEITGTVTGNVSLLKILKISNKIAFKFKYISINDYKIRNILIIKKIQALNTYLILPYDCCFTHLIHVKL